MEISTAAVTFSALAHSGRLETFRLLVTAGKDGLPAGEIARSIGSPASSLSANLNILSGAGLVASRRDGRSVIYTAEYDRMRDLLAFLVDDCCGGRPEICAPLAEIAARPCAAEGSTC